MGKLYKGLKECEWFAVSVIKSAKVFLPFFNRIQSHVLHSVVQGCASSIPTKYQTIIISNEEKKGFSSQSKRFQDHLVI